LASHRDTFCCVEQGCPNEPTHAIVETNYLGYLGEACDEHWQKLIESGLVKADA
jgi:hypothetical protein